MDLLMDLGSVERNGSVHELKFLRSVSVSTEIPHPLDPSDLGSVLKFQGSVSVWDRLDIRSKGLLDP